MTRFQPSGGNVRLEDQTFTNSDTSDGTNALKATGGTWRVYSQDPTTDSDNGAHLSYSFVQYGATNSYATPFTTANAALNGAATGNGFLYTVSPTARETLAGTFDKTYDGTNTVTSPLTSAIYAGGVTGTINGDTVTFNNPINSPTGTATAIYAGTNAGTYAITLSPTVAIATATDVNGATIFGYGQNITNNLSGTISKASLTFTPKAVSVAYDGSTLNNTTYSDTLGTYTIGGFQGSDTQGNTSLTLTGSMAFNGSTGTAVKNAATYTQAAGTLSLTSTNYTLSFSNPTPNNYVITPKALTVTPDAVSVVYDGTTLNNTTYSDNTGNSNT